MNILQALILGIVQGIAEFLPISSSGHLVLLQHIFKIKEASVFFDVILHVGTLVPVLIVFRKEILELIKNPFQKITFFLIIATIPAVIVALVFGDEIDKIFATGKYIFVGFFLTGCLLIYADKVAEKKKSDPNFVDAIIIGLMQSIAILPGLSRSGSTISGAIFCGVNRESSAKFSFLLSIPAIAGALALQVKNILSGDIILENVTLLPCVVGFFVAAISGYFAINFLLNIIKKAKLKYFAYYVFILAIFTFSDQFFFHAYF